MTLSLSKEELLSARIRLGEIELIFDTSALLMQGVSLDLLQEHLANHIRLIASPYCSFEGVRHLDDSGDFDEYQELMQKIELIGVADLPTFESSEELGLKEFNRRQRKDRAFAAAHNIANFCIGVAFNEFQDEQLLTIRW